MKNKEKTIYDLKLHEQMEVGTGFFQYGVMRVANGWIYQCLNPSNHSMTSMFVPFDDEFMKSGSIKPVKPNKIKT